MRKAFAAVADRNGSGKKVVHGAAENGAENYPQITGRTELRTHDGAENGPQAGNVQKLYHEHFPRRKCHKINAIVLADGGRDSIVRSKNAIDEFSVENIS